MKVHCGGTGTLCRTLLNFLIPVYNRIWTEKAIIRFLLCTGIGKLPVFDTRSELTNTRQCESKNA
jgi:hypothetical protein